jgi:hypothetical protein
MRRVITYPVIAANHYSLRGVFGQRIETRLQVRINPMAPIAMMKFDGRSNAPGRCQNPGGKDVGMPWPRRGDGFAPHTSGWKD